MFVRLRPLISNGQTSDQICLKTVIIDQTINQILISTSIRSQRSYVQLMLLINSIELMSGIGQSVKDKNIEKLINWYNCSIVTISRTVRPFKIRFFGIKEVKCTKLSTLLGTGSGS